MVIAKLDTSVDAMPFHITADLIPGDTIQNLQVSFG